MTSNFLIKNIRMNIDVTVFIYTFISRELPMLMKVAGLFKKKKDKNNNNFCCYKCV